MEAFRQLGRYVLGERLAAGGMGEVFLAVQQGLGEYQKPLALKLLLPHLMEDASAVQMFVDEATLAARMSHPNVVQIFDVGVAGGRYFLAMELVHGVSLSTLMHALRASGQVASPPLLSYVARALCEGLHHAHEQVGPDGESLGLVHRDVTPQNVLVSVHGEVKLTDFGIAKARKGPADPRLMGKAGFMAPELVERGWVDRRTDIFAAGVTLHDLATLEIRDPDELTPKPLTELSLERAELAGAFSDAIARATAQNAGERFATARAFRDALPNLATPQTGEELGALVASLCRANLSRLDGKTQAVIELGKTAVDRSPRKGTLLDPIPPTMTSAKVTPGVAPVATRLAPLSAPLAPAKARPRGAWIASGALLGLAATGVLAWWLRRSEPPPALPPAPVVVAPPSSTPPAAVIPQRAEPAPVPAAPPPVPARAASPREEPRPTAVRSARAPVAPAGTRTEAPQVGYLSVATEPAWALVKIDGKVIGETPIAKYPVPPGRVWVTASNPKTGQEATQRVRVTPGKDVRLRLLLHGGAAGAVDGQPPTVDDEPR